MCVCVEIKYIGSIYEIAVHFCFGLIGCTLTLCKNYLSILKFFESQDSTNFFSNERVELLQLMRAGDHFIHHLLV